MTIVDTRREELLSIINKYKEILNTRGFLTEEEREIVRESFFEMYMMDTGKNPTLQ